MNYLIQVAAVFISHFQTHHIITFLMRKMPLFGYDYHKQPKTKLPEAIGLASGLSFIVSIFIVLIFQEKNTVFYKYLAITSSCMFTILLGLIDDLLDLAWRFKLVFPAVSSIPTILLYQEGTSVLIPLFGLTEIGFLYYVYMLCFSVFTTNSINILSGINGLEVSQVIIVSFFMLLDAIIKQDTFVILLTSLLICTSIPVYTYNKYPAKVFVGDTYCYFGGMALSCLAILSHTTRTLFLLMGIQFINFVISLPQLFKLYECPRHRMPDYDGKRLVCSWTENGTRLNLTLLNVILYIFGPMREDELLNLVIHIEIFWCSVVLLFKHFIYNPYSTIYK